MALFRSLRDKLKGVSKKLEDEVEKQLGDEVERQLAAEMAKDKAKALAAPALPPVQPPISPIAPTGAPPPPAPTTPKTETPPAMPSAPASTSSSMPSGSSARDSSESLEARSPATGQGASASVPSGVPPPAPARVSPAPSPKVQPPQPPPQAGRKLLTEDEISAKLERELSQAVAVQKSVETTVHEGHPAAAKFTINEDVLEEILWDLEVGLLESDVALPVIEAIKADVKEQLLSLAIGGKPDEVVERVLRNAIKHVLQVNPMDFDTFIRDKIASGKKPVVIMFVGVNGTGKTTSIGRLAYRLKQQGISCCLAAGDTFRAGAIEQLALHGERLGVTVIQHKAGADPAAVAYDAIEHAKARRKDVVLLDTAGRMQNNSNLMDEMDKIRRVANPDLCIFVGDSLAGNDAVEQARKFDEIVDVGGVILTKVDVDAKGGAALSVAYTINKPLLFVGVGQNYPDLKPFDAEWLVSRLFGDDDAPDA